MAGIFVSYRREDSGGYAGRIADGLQQRFGAEAIFRDVDSLRGGLSFETALDQRLRQCDAMVVVIGRQWASIADPHGRPRLLAADDWVRREIEEGLRRGIPVIPVLVGGATLPRKDELPESLQPLLVRQAIELRDGRAWKGDLRLLGDDIEEAAGHEVCALGRALRRLRGRWPWLAVGAAAVAALAVYLSKPQPAPLDTDPLFDARLEEADTCFTHDPATGGTYAEFGFRLLPMVSDPQRVVRVFLGIAKVFDAARVPEGFDPAPEPCSEPACLAVHLWDEPERPTVLRGGTEGTVVRFSATLPTEATRVVVFGRFYQREGAGGTECAVDKSRPYERGTQLPFLVRVDRAGRVVGQACDGALDSRTIPVERRAGRYCLK